MYMYMYVPVYLSYSTVYAYLSHTYMYTHTHTQHSIIDEPIDYGVGIVASTDNWSVKIMSATKNLHTRSANY
jgi:hypothetical protein